MIAGLLGLENSTDYEAIFGNRI